MGKKKNIWNNYNILLIVALILLATGAYLYIHRENQIYPFFGISVKQVDTGMQTQLLVQGQCTTKGEGFFVGKETDVSVMLLITDVQQYDNLKNLLITVPYVSIDNTQPPEDYNRDRTQAIKEGDIDNSFVNPGLIKMTNFYDDKKTIVLEGRVVLKSEGTIQFGQPLSFILQNNGIQLKFPTVEPASTKYQIDLNRTVLLLTFITLGTGFLIPFLLKIF